MTTCVLSSYRLTPEREKSLDKKLLLSCGKGAQLLRKQLINDIVCGYYSEEDAVRHYGVSPNRLIAWMRKLGLKSSLNPRKKISGAAPAIQKATQGSPETVD